MLRNKDTGTAINKHKQLVISGYGPEIPGADKMLMEPNPGAAELISPRLVPPPPRFPEFRRYMNHQRARAIKETQIHTNFVQV